MNLILYFIFLFVSALKPKVGITFKTLNATIPKLTTRFLDFNKLVFTKHIYVSPKD